MCQAWRQDTLRAGWVGVTVGAAPTYTRREARGVADASQHAHRTRGEAAPTHTGREARGDPRTTPTSTRAAGAAQSTYMERKARGVVDPPRHLGQGVDRPPLPPGVAPLFSTSCKKVSSPWRAPTNVAASMRHVALAVAVAVAVGCGSWFGPTATSRVCDSSMPMLSASDTEATATVHPASCGPACVGAAALPWSRARRVCRSTMARSVGVGASRTSNPKPGMSVNVVDVVAPQETLRGSGHSLALCRCEAGVGHGAGWGGRGGSGRVRYSSQGAGATLAAQPGGLDDVVRVEAGAARRREAARLELGDVAPPGPRARARRLRRNVYPAAFRVWVGVDTARRPGSALAQ